MTKIRLPLIIILRRGITLAFMLSCVVFLTSACSQQIFRKEKVVEKMANPQPAIQVDQFIHQTPIGPVDFLFLVDNTESGIGLSKSFKTGYLKFLEDLRKNPDLHQVDSYVQVATLPLGATPPHFIASNQAESDRQAHIDEVFNGVGSPEGQMAPLLNFWDVGFLDFYTAIPSALSHKAYENRSFVPLFLVMWMGSDLGPELDTNEGNLRLISLLKETRGLHQSHSILLSRHEAFGTSDSAPGEIPRNCENFQPASRAMSAIQTPHFPWASFISMDLCGSDWESFRVPLLNSVLDFKRRMILSRIPYQPELMVVRSGNHLFRYGDDYLYNPTTNEVIFKDASPLQKGDLLTVSYYLAPKNDSFSGNPSPNPIPSSPGATP